MPHLAYDDNQIPENQTSFINPYEQDEQQTESEMLPYGINSSRQSDALLTAEDIKRKVTSDPFAFMINEIRYIPDADQDRRSDPQRSGRSDPSEQMIETVIKVDRYCAEPV